MARVATRTRTVEYSVEKALPERIAVTYVYTVSGPPVPQMTAGELKLGDRVRLTKLTNDSGYGLAVAVPYRSRGPVGVVTEIRWEDERPAARGSRRMLVTFAREGAKSMDVMYVVPDSPVVLAKVPARAASS